MLAELADRLASLVRSGELVADDPLIAAHHFVGLLLWIPINRAMFTGDQHADDIDLDSYADAAVGTSCAHTLRPRPEPSEEPTDRARSAARKGPEASDPGQAGLIRT